MAATVHHVIGLGRFGRQAVAALTGRGEVVPVGLDHPPAPGERVDGVAYLARLVTAPPPGEHRVIPTVPFHLAARTLARLTGAVPAPWPEELPPWPGALAGPPGDLYTSLAPGRCPADCPGPGPACVHPGREPGTRLPEVLAGTPAPGLPHRVLVSRQLAPGVGGFNLTDLVAAHRWMVGLGGGQVILSTASACHGVSTRLELPASSPPEPADG